MGRKQIYLNDEEKVANRRYNQIKSRAKINWEKKDFILWYIKENKKGCFYCKSTIEEIKAFHKTLPQIKINLKRGQNLEIDRIEDTEYSESNCVFACYYCNNAKSDIFSKEEFIIIAKGIGKVIKERIKV